MNYLQIVVGFQINDYNNPYKKIEPFVVFDPLMRFYADTTTPDMGGSGSNSSNFLTWVFPSSAV